jgi:hypothetical protein
MTKAEVAEQLVSKGIPAQILRYIYQLNTSILPWAKSWSSVEAGSGISERR